MALATRRLSQLLARRGWRGALVVVLIVGMLLPGHALAQAIPTPSPAPQIGAVLVYEDFQDPARGILLHSVPAAEGSEQGYEAGYYVLRGTEDDWQGDVELPVPGTFRDSRVSIEVSSIGERAGGVYLQCRMTDGHGYGGVFFLDDGAYFLGRREGDSVRRLTSPSRGSPYGRFRHAGLTLDLACVGDRISLALDGIELATARDATYAEGSAIVGMETLEREDDGSFEMHLKKLIVNDAFPGAAPAPATSATAARPREARPSMSEPDVTANVSPSIVRVISARGRGSGVALAEGIITNEHVVRGSQEVQIERGDGTRQRATVLRSDAAYDLALVSNEGQIAPLEIEGVRQQRQGDSLLAIGYPADLPGSATVSRGLLSAIREFEGVTYVQTDAAMSGGSSGGAIVNLRGSVIGITRGAIGTAGSLNVGISGESIRAFLDDQQLVAPDVSEPDTSLQDAKPLALGAPAQLRNLHVRGDVDWFSVQIAAGQQVAISTDADRCDTMLEVFAPDGVTLLGDDDDSGRNSSSWVELTAPESGVYYGLVQEFRGGSCQSYYLAARPI